MRKLCAFLVVCSGLGVGATPALGQGYGQSVAASAQDVLVGESLNERQPGFVYVYRNEGSGWTEVQRLEATDATDGDHFGRALGVSGDHLLVGATVVDETRGAVYVFERDAQGSWSQVDKIMASDGVGGDAFGRSMAVSGDIALVSSWANADSRGAVYVLRRGGRSREGEDREQCREREREAARQTLHLLTV